MNLNKSKDELVLEYQYDVFRKLSEETDFNFETGSESYRNQLNEIDLNGKTTPEYWYPKITVLCHYFFKSETESDKIIAMQVYGTILLYGWKGSLEKIKEERERGVDKYSILCKACEKLGYTSDSSFISEDILKNRTKIENLRTIFESISSIADFEKNLVLKAEK